MQVRRGRENVFTVTITSQELSALVAAARLAHDAMQDAPTPPPQEALALLARVLADYDRAVARIDMQD